MANNVYCPENTTWYDTWQLWDDAAASTLTSTWTGEQANVELTGKVTISGSTASATNYKIMKCGSGASFKDNANAATNALRYNASNGAALKSTGNYDMTITVVDDYTVIQDLQITSTYASGIPLYINCSSNSIPTTVKNCIIEQGNTGGYFYAVQVAKTVKMINCLIVNRSTQNNANRYGVYIFTDTSATGTCGFYNCTIVKPSGNAYSHAIYKRATYGGAPVVNNCAMFGFAGSTTGTFSSSSGYNATDYSSAPGSNNQVSATYADQFEVVTDSTRDYRAK